MFYHKNYLKQNLTFVTHWSYCTLTQNIKLSNSELNRICLKVAVILTV